MRFSVGRTTLYLLALLLTPLAAAAQTGTLMGTVRDNVGGSPVAGASIEVLAPDGRVGGVTTTAADGSFRVTNLAPGRYTLVVTGANLTSRRVDVEVRAGQSSRADLQVALSSIVLDPVVISASRRPEKALDAPARVEVVAAREIEDRPVTTPVEHLRNVPGVDIATTGVQSANVVARGFNNIFSGALHALHDYRIVGAPSLRVNLLHTIPATNEDVERMEVVLGPGAALYGPNTANGILHVLTRSPLNSQGTVLTTSGGFHRDPGPDATRGTWIGSFRTAHLLSSNLGIKLSGQYLRSHEWEYTDPAEVAEQAKFASNRPLFRADLMRAAGIDQAAADVRIDRIGDRDNEIERWSGEARADWRMASNATAVFSVGRSSLVRGIELTGLGAAQTSNWSSSYYQARANWSRLFAQVYLNRSDAGDTYLLRNGAPITDRSYVIAGQLQHGVDLGARQRFTYGADYIFTNPRTEGTVNGWYEDDDQTREFGAYLQSETAITPRLDLVLAGRGDTHSALPAAIFSPRAAVVFKPFAGHALRASYNRAFSTPGSLNQFLDLGSALPGTGDPTDPSFLLRQLGYSLRIQGTGRNGFRFRQPDGGYQFRSPFTPAGVGGPETLLPATSTALFPLAFGVVRPQVTAGLRAQFIAAGMSEEQATAQANAIAGYIAGLQVPGGTVGLNYLSIAAGAAPGIHPLSSLDLDDVAPLRESTSETFEIGYKGLIGGRLLIAADYWRSRRRNLITPLTIQTPFLLVDGPQLAGFLVPRLMQDLGMSQAQATAVATAVATGTAQIPAGVISSADVNANGGQLLVTYLNVDETIDISGRDISARVIVTPDLTLGASASFVNDYSFETESVGLVTLNAPKRKGSIFAEYMSEDNGLSGQLRLRHTGGFPVSSGVYIGTRCLGDTSALAEDCVRSYTLLDANFGYRLPFQRQTSVQLAVTNLLDENYRPFPGVPTMGRMVIARLKYEF
jgi:outer membrane receptor for ferrienterochelin and colicins